MTVSDCIDEYKSLCDDVFGRRRFFSTLRFGLGNRPKYEAARLEKTFKGIIARHDRYPSGLSGDCQYLCFWTRPLQNVSNIFISMHLRVVIPCNHEPKAHLN